MYKVSKCSKELAQSNRFPHRMIAGFIDVLGLMIVGKIFDEDVLISSWPAPPIVDTSL